MNSDNMQLFLKLYYMVYLRYAEEILLKHEVMDDRLSQLETIQKNYEKIDKRVVARRVEALLKGILCTGIGSHENVVNRTLV